MGVWGQHTALTPVVLVLGQEAAGRGDGGHGGESTGNPAWSGRSLRGKGFAVPGDRMGCARGKDGLWPGDRMGRARGDWMGPTRGAVPLPRPRGSPACPSERGRAEAEW